MKLLIKQVLNPLLGKVGTALAGYLAAQGVGADTTQQIVTGLIALALVTVDLVIDNKLRPQEKR